MLFALQLLFPSRQLLGHFSLTSTNPKNIGHFIAHFRFDFGPEVTVEKNLHRKWVHYQNKVVFCVVVFGLSGDFVVLVVVYILFLVLNRLDRTFVFSVRTILNLVSVHLLGNIL